MYYIYCICEGLINSSKRTYSRCHIKHADLISQYPCFFQLLQFFPPKRTPCFVGVQARAVALATGTADVPRRLGVPGEDLEFVTHRPPIHHQAGVWIPVPHRIHGTGIYIYLYSMDFYGKYR